MPHGRLHVDEYAAIENHAEEHEHVRPSPRAGKAGNTYASAGHEDQQQMHRFAKQVVAWMERHITRFGPQDDVPLFAAPRFLGELRKLYGPALSGRVVEQKADLTQLTPGGLAKHPAVEALLAQRLGGTP